MLPPAMIRKFGKGYSDKQIRNKIMRSIPHDAQWWTNGFIAFREPLPRCFEDTAVKLNITDPVARWNKEVTRQVWPVEIAPMNEDAFPVVRFTDGNSLSIWCDAGYISAILKREPQAQWFVNPDKYGAPIAARNGQTCAFVMPMSRETSDLINANWRISNTDLSAARDLETCWGLQALLPSRPGSKWHVVTYKDRHLDIRRHRPKRLGKGKKAQCLSVRIEGEVFTFSLYDGRGIEV